MTSTRKERNQEKRLPKKSKGIKDQKNIAKQRTIPEKSLRIPRIDKKHTPTHN